MKRGTSEHPKFVDLQMQLDRPKFEVVGLLEALWHWVAKYTPDGGVGKYRNGAIARALEWPADADELVRTLCATGWLDERADCRLYIHDWHDHADDSVHRQLARAVKPFANGALPNIRRLSVKERKRIEAAFAARAHDVRTSGAPRAPHQSQSQSQSPALPEPEPKASGVRTLVPLNSGASLPDQTRKPARRGRGWTVGKAVALPPFNIHNVREEDLRQPERYAAFYRAAVDGGLASDTDLGRVCFYARREHALRISDTPVALFMSNLLEQRKHWSTDDEDQARRVLRELDAARPIDPRVAGIVDGLMAGK